MTNFIGEWKIRDRSGKLMVYNIDDEVSKDGNFYVATKITSGYSPEHLDRGGWKKINKVRSINFTSSETAPVNPVQGDEWWNSLTGVLYKYIDDGNSKQWVSI